MRLAKAGKRRDVSDTVQDDGVDGAGMGNKTSFRCCLRYAELTSVLEPKTSFLELPPVVEYCWDNWLVEAVCPRLRLLEYCSILLHATQL